MSALRLAIGLLWGTDKRIAFLDTENESASLYAPPEGEAADGVKTFDFDSIPVKPPYDSDKFLNGAKAAVANGYGALVIDSASHFWKGILAFKDQLDRRGGNSYTNWGDADKKFDPVIEEFLQSPLHVICCMRSKMDYVIEENAKGKQAPRAVGLAPIMRDNIAYEFTAVFDVAMDHTAKTSKDRTGLFGDRIFQVTEDTGREIAAWLKTAKPKSEPQTLSDSAREAIAAAELLRKRVSRRAQAVDKERPEHVPVEDWRKTYAACVCAVRDIPSKAFADLDGEDLDATPKEKHEEIMAEMKAGSVTK